MTKWVMLPLHTVPFVHLDMADAGPARQAGSGLRCRVHLEMLAIAHLEMQPDWGLT